MTRPTAPRLTHTLGRLTNQGAPDGDALPILNRSCSRVPSLAGPVAGRRHDRVT